MRHRRFATVAVTVKPPWPERVCRMTAEAVCVAKRAAVQPAIVVSVAVQNEVAGAGGQIPAIAHAVVHPQLLEAVEASTRDTEIFRLRMHQVHRYLHTHHVKALEHATARRHQKCRHTVGVFDWRLDIAEVEHRQLTRIRDIADAALGDIVDDHPRTVRRGHVRVIQEISPASQPDGVAGSRRRLRLGDGSERAVARAGV